MSGDQGCFEVLNDRIQRGRIRFALFDFDGTLSLIREGWQEVMIPLLIDWLAECPRAEDPQTLEQFVKDYVARSTGIQTIFQMIWLAEQVQQRGGRALAPAAYKEIYNQRLNARIHGRLDDLASGRSAAQQWMVPGARQVLEHLTRLNCTVFCASGTDHAYVQNEAKLLGVAELFTGGLYGATEDYVNFSKKILIEKIFRDNQLGGPELLTFGDGYVEIEDTKGVEGIAVGVASDEVRRQGVDATKRARLIQAGADIIIPDFRQEDALLKWLFGGR